MLDRLIYINNGGASYWDYAPGCLIVEEAGGSVTDFLGKPWNSKTKNLAASNWKKHNEFLKILTN
jgi:myo-inositol-1(or 4)-monophosphatase